MNHPERIGKYRVLGLLGRGAMGVVYHARDDSLDRDVAVKVLGAGEADTEARARFEREAKAAARLQHPNIVTIYELGAHLGSPFIAMELLEGVDLQRAIEGGLRPDPKATLPIVLQLLAGLGHAHDHGIIHRDVKPSNIFLPRKRPAKIMDFGVARLGTGMMTKTGLMVGTPGYMSPEQVRAAPLDGRSDLFSAGLILYELVTGEKAFKEDSVIAVLYKIASQDVDLSILPREGKWERLRGVLARALARDREERHPDARTMAGELQLALQDLGGSVDLTKASDWGVMRSRAAPTTASTPAASEEGAGLAPPAPTQPARAPAAAPPAPAAPPRPAATRGGLLAAAVGIPILAIGGYFASGLLGHWSTRGSKSLSPAPTTTPAPPSTAASPVTAMQPSKPDSTSRRPGRPAPKETSAPPPREEEAPATGRLDRANTFFEQGRYAAALREAKAVLEREPGNAEARTIAEDAEAALMVETRLKNAQAALRRGDRETALAEVRAGLAVNSRDARLLALFRELTQ